MTEPPESAGAHGGDSGDGVPDLDLTSERDGGSRNEATPEMPGGDDPAASDVGDADGNDGADGGTDGTATPTGVSLDGQGITSVLYGSDGTAYHLDDTSVGEFREGDGRPLDGRGHTCSDIESGAVSIGTFEYNRTAGTFERTHA